MTMSNESVKSADCDKPEVAKKQKPVLTRDLRPKRSTHHRDRGEPSLFGERRMPRMRQRI